MLKKILLGCLIISVMIVTVYAVNQLVQTFPSITSDSGVFKSNCNVLNIYPGSVTPGSSGNIQATCFALAAITFFPGTATPTFSLAVGYDNIAIMQHPTNCNLHFPFNSNQTLIPSGRNLTGSGPITFSNTPTGSQLFTGGYDYCLHYSNAPVLGLQSFTITWS